MKCLPIWQSLQTPLEKKTRRKGAEVEKAQAPVDAKQWAYMLKEINYALATIIILCHTPFWSPDNDAKYVPKSQRLKHYAWLTHGIQQVTDTIT